MYARVISGQVKPEKLDEFARKWKETIKAGLQNESTRPSKIYLSADRSTGKIRTFGVLNQPPNEEAFNRTFGNFTSQVSDILTERPTVETFEILDTIEFD